MAFEENFEKIADLLKKLFDVNIDEQNYDAFCWKQLKASNCIDKNNKAKSKQSHIAITGEMMDMFPYIYSTKYVENDEKSFKNFYTLKASVKIFKSNCEYLDLKNEINFNEKDEKELEMCIYPRKDGGQVQLSMKDKDSPDFISFRSLIKPNDYIIFLKYENRVEYDVFGIKEKDAVDILTANCFEYNKESHFNTFVRKENFTAPVIDKPHQRIFFGAPGTGKSYQLNKEAQMYFGNDYERVTFHPNYMYGNFVGAFKPFPISTGEKYVNGIEKKAITYKYVPGPLMRLLVKAYKNPNKNFLLIVEEINRANTAAVFGDMFQLLDRNEEGESEYAITTSEDVRSYLADELSEMNVETFENLIFPSNFYIWATMNSADQGVQPMDTAFKRRWDFTYIGIDDASANDNFDKYKMWIQRDRELVLWDDLRKEINKKLIECHVPEDKLLGPYFISKNVLDTKDADIITDNFKRKVLMYLYEDAGKPYRRELFDFDKAGTYSELCINFDKDGNTVFTNGITIHTETFSESTDADGQDE